MTLVEEIESMQEVCKIITKRYKEKDLKNKDDNIFKKRSHKDKEKKNSEHYRRTK